MGVVRPNSAAPASQAAEIQVGAPPGPRVWFVSTGFVGARRRRALSCWRTERRCSARAWTVHPAARWRRMCSPVRSASSSWRGPSPCTAATHSACIAPQHGRSGPLAAPQLCSCTSSACVWWLWAARHSQEERPHVPLALCRTVLTRAPLRAVRPGYTYAPPARRTYPRHRAAGAPRYVHPTRASPGRAARTAYRVPVLAPQAPHAHSSGSGLALAAVHSCRRTPGCP